METHWTAIGTMDTQPADGVRISAKKGAAVFQKAKKDPRAEAMKVASLAVAMGIAAAGAYFGVVARLLALLASAIPTWDAPTIDQGILSYGDPKLNAHIVQFTGAYTSLAPAIIGTLPLAILAVLVFGVLGRTRPGSGVIAGLLIAGAALGLGGALALFLAVVVNARNGRDFIVALVTIVLVAVLLRVQRFVRRFFQRSPGSASLVFTVLVILGLVLSNGVNISSIVLAQIDVWLAIVAFAVALYAGIRLARWGQLHRRTGAR